MKVKECMCTEVSCVKPESTICDVAKLMLNKHVGCVPVCNEKNKIVGLLTDRDLILRSLAPVSEIMTTKKKGDCPLFSYCAYLPKLYI